MGNERLAAEKRTAVVNEGQAVELIKKDRPLSIGVSVIHY